MTRRGSILILGAGFAGLSAARALAGRYRATVVNSTPYFEFLANIHELLSGAKTPEVLRIPLKERVRHYGHKFIQDKVSGIDLPGRKVHTKSGQMLSYDALIVAFGGVDESFGVPGYGEHAYPFKTVDDCYRIGVRLKELAKRDAPFDVVVIGGGFEGVEAVGEILRRYRKNRGLNVRLVEGGPRLMVTSPKPVDRRVREIGEKYNVRFDLGVRVTKIEKDNVLLSTGERAPSDLTIWTGGLKPPELLSKNGLTKKARQWLDVGPTLQLAKHPEVFAVGDVAQVEPQLPKQAYHALTMGQLAAANVERILKNKSPQNYKSTNKPVLVSFGDLSGFMVWGDAVVESAAVTMAKEFVFHTVMASFDLPVSPRPAFRFAMRHANTFRSITVPALVSPERLWNLAQVRFRYRD